MEGSKILSDIRNIDDRLRRDAPDTEFSRQHVSWFSHCESVEPISHGSALTTTSRHSLSSIRCSQRRVKFNRFDNAYRVSLKNDFFLLQKLETSFVSVFNRGRSGL